MSELGKLALDIYEYICDQIALGNTPSVREIGTALSIRSTSTVHKYLKQLESAGYIHMRTGTNRNIKIADPTAMQIPVMGTVTAGQPILAVENITEYLPIDLQRGYSPKELLALKVRGDSMINAGILDGDIIVVHRTPVAANGEIVVALIEDEATVKRFYKENGHFRLMPENEAYEPIIVDEVRILGRVVSLVRHYSL